MILKEYRVTNVGSILFELPDHCPMCKAAISPLILTAVSSEDLFSYNSKEVSAALACPSCHKLFVVIFSEIESTNRYSPRYIAPHQPSIRDFGDDGALQEISPLFVDIYHQAEAAEAYGLNQVTGIAYRKSLEFLVKDYAIRQHPEQSEDIKTTPLAKCIDRFIELPKIQATAKAATWLGNDETHYIRKWEDKDINDLKKFISSCVYWVLADSTYTEADKMVNT